MTEYNEQRVKEALSTGANNAIMAQMLGVSERTMRRWKAKLALVGFAPEADMTRQCPDGFKVKGVSSLYNKDGVLAAQWVKTSADSERRYEMMLEAVEALKEEIPRVTLMKAPSPGADNLLNVYTITDYHFGMLAWNGFNPYVLRTSKEPSAVIDHDCRHELLKVVMPPTHYDVGITSYRFNF